MILIPEQVKALRKEILRLEEKKRDYESYLKDCEKSSMDLGFLKYTDTTKEVDDYNAICKSLDIYKRTLRENEFMILVILILLNVVVNLQFFMMILLSMKVIL